MGAAKVMALDLVRTRKYIVERADTAIFLLDKDADSGYFAANSDILF
jgi:hypothetical protein